MCEKMTKYVISEITKSGTLPKAGISATFLTIGSRVALLELPGTGHSLPIGKTST